MCPVITLFGFDVSTYAVLIIIGFCAGLAVALLRHKINGLRVDDILVCLLIAAGGALFGAKLFYVVQGFGDFLIRARETGYTFFEYFRDAGLVYYGGFIGGILFLLLGAKVTGAPLWAMVDTVLPSVPLMHAIGRIGCIFAGCCFGMPSNIGFYFNASPFAPHGVKLFPIQLIEALCLLGLFFFMLYYGRKKRENGKVLSLYLIAYGIIRFILEFFRYDAYRGIYGALSISQWVSIVLIALGLFFALAYPKIKRNKDLSKDTPART